MTIELRRTFKKKRSGVRLPDGGDGPLPVLEAHLRLSEYGVSEDAAATPFWGLLETIAWIATRNLALVDGIKQELADPQMSYAELVDRVRLEVRQGHCVCGYKGALCRCWKSAEGDLTQYCVASRIAAAGRAALDGVMQSEVPNAAWLGSGIEYEPRAHLQDRLSGVAWWDLHFAASAVRDCWAERQVQPVVEAEREPDPKTRATNKKPYWYPMLRQEFEAKHNREAEFIVQGREPPVFPSAAWFRQKLIDRKVDESDVPLSTVSYHLRALRSEFGRE